MSSTAGAIATPVLRRAAQAAAQAILSLLVALALAMLVRRMSGALVQPLAGTALVVVAAILVVVTFAARVMLLDSVARTTYLVLRTRNSVFGTRHSAIRARNEIHDPAPANHILFALPGLSAAILLAALTLSGTPAAAIALAWFILSGSEGLSWLFAYRPELLRGVRTCSSTTNASELAESAEEANAELPIGLVQQFTRVRESGRESIHAVLLAEIPAGDRQGAIHVAFCPPLDQKPDLTAHALDADDADVRITQAETFGARIELRLPAVADDQRAALVELLGSAICR